MQPASVRARRDGRRRREDARPSPVPFRHGHTVLGATRRPRHRPGLLRSRRFRRARSGSRRMPGWSPSSSTPTSTRRRGRSTAGASTSSTRAPAQSIGCPRWSVGLQTMAGLLKPGGLFYFAEFHPFTGVFGDDDLAVTQSYFERGPFAYDEPGTYADPAAPTATTGRSNGTTASATSSPHWHRLDCASSCCTSTTTPCMPAGRFSPPTSATTIGCPTACRRCR